MLTFRYACRDAIEIPRSRSDCEPEFEAGRVAGHRARRLIGGENPAFSDPFLLMAEDWVPRDAFSRPLTAGSEPLRLCWTARLSTSIAPGIRCDLHRRRPVDDRRPWRDYNETPCRARRRTRFALGGPARQREDGSAALPGSQKGEPSHATGAGCRDSPSIRQLQGRLSPTLNHVPVTAIDARVDDGAMFEHELGAGANAFLLFRRLSDRRETRAACGLGESPG